MNFSFSPVSHATRVSQVYMFGDLNTLASMFGRLRLRLRLRLVLYIFMIDMSQ